jgi:DNA-binding FadR family transcriptional regulator
VADQLRRHIGLGLVAAGETFPPERELARMFGVGRATIQYALRLLEAERLIESRRGRGGGTFVIGPQRDAQGLERLLFELHLNREEIQQALAFRRVVEAGAVRLTCEQARPEELDAIQAANEAMERAVSELEFHRADTEFHLLIAKASHNDLLYASVERARLLLNSAILAQPESELWHDRIIKEHKAIIRAVRDRSPQRATRAIGTHLTHSEQGIRALLAVLRPGAA